MNISRDSVRWWKNFGTLWRGNPRHRPTSGPCRRLPDAIFGPQTLLGQLIFALQRRLRAEGGLRSLAWCLLVFAGRTISGEGKMNLAPPDVRQASQQYQLSKRVSQAERIT